MYLYVLFAFQIALAVCIDNGPVANNYASVKAGVIPDEPSDALKMFIRSKEQFWCEGKPNGFYASRWCNIFYRCYNNIKYEFICARMVNNDRLWWTLHGSSQSLPQVSAQCAFPCDTKRQCSSPGGIIVEMGMGMFMESTMDAARVWKQCCEQNNNNNMMGMPGVPADGGDLFSIPDPDPSCMGAPEGCFIASKYCNVFHRCLGGKRRDFLCAKATNSPYELWWNPATNQCDWPCKVQCMKPIYGTMKSAAQIQMEDRSLNQNECRAMQMMPGWDK